MAADNLKKQEEAEIIPMRVVKSESRKAKKEAKRLEKEQKKATKKRSGDRRDGKLIHTDPMHFIVPVLYPNRCDNEAYISEVLDLTHLDEYLEKKNAEIQGTRISPFVVIVAAMCKTLYLRPKMNHFIANSNTYKRNEVTASFVIKKHYNDNGEEGLAFIHTEPGDTLETIHEKINKQIYECRNEVVKDSTQDAMEFFTNHLPRFISKTAIHFIMWLDKHGWVPKSFIENDPYYSSVVLTYLGSIKLHAGYHHLTNWGTNSVFVSVGEKKLRPFYDRRGEMTLKDSIDIGLTIDERLADGYYYSKTIRLMKKLVENPELLELPLSEEVSY